MGFRHCLNDIKLENSRVVFCNSLKYNHIIVDTFKTFVDRIHALFSDVTVLIKFLNLYSLPVLISLGLCIGIGLWDLVLEPKGIPAFIGIIFFTTILIIYIKQTSHVFFRKCALILFFLITLYIATGTGFLQGHMSIGIIASVFQTNQNEALEFFSVLQYQYVLYALILLVGICYFFFYKKEIYSIKLHKFFIAIVLVVNVFNLFFIQTARAVINYKKEEKLLYAGNKIVPDWKVEAVNAPYDNQVFIIGESVQRNYLSLYGYPKKTTPFLDSMPLTVIDEYISTSANTAPSLPRTLAYIDKDNNIHIAMNVMSLAKQAKYNTIWISNQGFVGKNDTAVSKIAIHADQKRFLKSGNYMSQDIDDNEMIAMLAAELNKYKDQKNIIFIHMMGSHPDACERLFDSPKLYADQSKSMNCYLSSINKLDGFIQQVYQTLTQTKRSFNITYFSDHGMSVTEDAVYVDNEYKANYQVPFFVLSSDVKQKNYMNKSVSAFDFMDIYAGLIGVKTPYLDTEKSLTEIKSNTDIAVFNWKENVAYHSLKE